VVLYVSEIDPNFNHMVTPSGVTMTTKAWPAYLPFNTPVSNFCSLL
jgi:hypothetical protein